MERVEFQLYNNNIKLNIITHDIEQPPSAIVIHIHGFLSSFSIDLPELYLFENRIKLLKPLNILSYALELRGHGKSENVNICNSTIDDYSDDLGALIEYISIKHPDIKIHILSVSLGGLITINYLIKNNNSNIIKSIILMSPCIKLVPSIHNLFCKLNKKNIFIISNLCNPIISLFNNTELITNYNSYEKLICIKNILNSINFINNNKDKFNIPVISMQSKFDLLTDSNATKLFIDNCDSTDKKIIIFKNSYNHYLFKDTDLLDNIKKNIYNWLESHI
jgi:acylglycerol lipase